MDIAAIVRQIDAEIDKLQRARTLIANLATPAPPTKKKTRPQVAPTAETSPEPASVAPLPSLTVVPPRVKRAYHRRARVQAQEPRALASAVSAKPVFVPRAAAVAMKEPVVAPPAFNPEAMEAAMRQSLLGGAA